MSGSSGSNYIAPKEMKYDCIGKITSTVSSINLLVLKKHKVGDILDVIIGLNEALLLEDGDGEILGSILNMHTSEIIECIQAGYTYKAHIVSISTPACKVEIRKA